MWRITAIVLVVVFSVVGSGLPGFLHGRQHEGEMRAWVVAQLKAHGKGQQGKMPGHGERSCAVCRQLQAPAIVHGAGAVIMDAGGWLRVAAMRGEGQRSQTKPERMGCRGPPVGGGCSVCVFSQ